MCLLWERVAGGAGVSLQGCGVSGCSVWQPSILHIQPPPMSHATTCNLDDEKQFLFLFLLFFNALPESLSPPMMKNFK